ncbi:MAG: methyltransferase [Verrucomicrobia bacterium]|nr:methyltransferase [Verrucomicrobiota bacterium]
MTSRERVLSALNHVEPDRIPLDLSGHRSSGISAIAYAKLRKYFGLEGRPLRVYDPVQQLAIVDEEVLGRFGIDTIELGRAFALEDKHWADWVLPDGTPCQVPVWTKPERLDGEWVVRGLNDQIIARMPDGVLYFEQSYYPFAEDDNLDRLTNAFRQSMWTAIASPPGPLAAGAEGERVLAEGARALRTKTDRAIIGLFGGNLLEMGQFFYRNDNFFMLLAGHPARAHEFLDKIMEIHLANLERFLGAVGEHIDIILFGDDLGMQNGPQVSPKMYREFFKPREKILWQRAKELADVKIMLHCCGGVRELLPDLIEVGLDTINPVQITCRGMEPAGLKKDFGDRLTFWGGGCDTRELLSKGTPHQVREHVKRLTDIWRPGGGYVFQQVHNILADVPPENIVAMYDALNGAG